MYVPLEGREERREMGGSETVSATNGLQNCKPGASRHIHRICISGRFFFFFSLFAFLFHSYTTHFYSRTAF